jgi:hypothetical protein
MKRFRISVADFQQALQLLEQPDATPHVDPSRA